jgi:recombination protein RecA
MITGGGILEGSMVTISGPAKGGKSLTALFFSANAQKPEFGGEFCPNGRDIYYYNVEGRLRERDLQGIPGLNIDKFHIIQSTPGQILKAEEILQIANILINDKPGAVHIIDSYSALCTEAEFIGGMSDLQRADGPKLLAKFCRKISNIIPVNKSIVIGIVHLMHNVSGYGQAVKEKSGLAIQYHVDTRLRCKTFRPWKLSVDGNQIGQEVDWNCECSPLGPPGQSTTSYIRYGEGIDKVQELITLCVDLNIIQHGGAWYTIGEQKFQGLENLNQAIKKDTSLYKQLEDQLFEMIGIR